MLNNWRTTTQPLSPFQSKIVLVSPPSCYNLDASTMGLLLFCFVGISIHHHPADSVCLFKSCFLNLLCPSVLLLKWVLSCECVVCTVYVLSHSVMSEALQPYRHSLPASSVHGDSLGKNTGMGCHALLQVIFPTQGSNPGLWHCRQILFGLKHPQTAS